jgi:hypothetical protein
MRKIIYYRLDRRNFRNSGGSFVGSKVSIFNEIKLSNGTPKITPAAAA